MEKPYAKPRLRKQLSAKRPHASTASDTRSSTTAYLSTTRQINPTNSRQLSSQHGAWGWPGYPLNEFLTPKSKLTSIRRSLLAKVRSLLTKPSCYPHEQGIDTFVSRQLE